MHFREVSRIEPDSKVNMSETLAKSVDMVLPPMVSVMAFNLSVAFMFMIGATLTIYAVPLNSSYAKEFNLGSTAICRSDEL
jgi:hypothetical protein